MKQSKLLQLIKKDLLELNELTAELYENNTFSKLEVEIALSKSRLIMQEFELLREQMPEKTSTEFTQETKQQSLKTEAYAVVKETETDSFAESISEKEEPDSEQKESPKVTEYQNATTEDEEITKDTVSPQINDDLITEVPPTSDYQGDNNKTMAQELEEKNTEISETDDTENSTTEDDHAKIVGENFAKGKSLNDMLSENHTLDQKLASSPIEKLSAAIGLNDRFQYIRELFNEDTDLFNQTITKIDQMKDIRQAVDYLSTHFKWKKNDTSLKFIQLIKRRFLS